MFLQPGLVNQMISAAEERPWLWIVYVLSVALPLVLIIVFCCTGKVCDILGTIKYLIIIAI